MEYLALQSGTYSADIVPLDKSRGYCDKIVVQTVVGTMDLPQGKVVQTADFSDVAVLKIEVTGKGSYRYGLNGGNFQTQNEFYDVPTGQHLVIIENDNGGCGFFEIPVTVLKHPKFFTPNGDGMNDSWNIWDLKSDPGAEIFIYNRYGVFLKRIVPNSVGWDGTLNGIPLPSNDYWFKVKYTIDNESKVYRSHFALKR